MTNLKAPQEALLQLWANHNFDKEKFFEAWRKNIKFKFSDEPAKEIEIYRKKLEAQAKEHNITNKNVQPKVSTKAK